MLVPFTDGYSLCASDSSLRIESNSDSQIAPCTAHNHSLDVNLMQLQTAIQMCPISIILLPTLIYLTPPSRFQTSSHLAYSCHLLTGYSSEHMLDQVPYSNLLCYNGPVCGFRKCLKIQSSTGFEEAVFSRPTSLISVIKRYPNSIKILPSSLHKTQFLARSLFLIFSASYISVAFTNGVQNPFERCTKLGIAADRI
jgi:hypothetical protein